MYRRAVDTFTLYDIIVELVAGTTFLLVILAVLPAESVVMNVMQASPVILHVALLPLAYIAGLGLQGVASTIIDREKRFQERMQNVRLGESDSHIDKAVWEGIIDQFSLPETYRSVEAPPDEYEEEQDAFWLIHTYLLDNDIGRVPRFEALYGFHRSVYVMFVIAAVLFAASATLTWLGVYQSILSSGVVAASASLIALICAWVFRQRMKHFDKAHDRNIINSYYTAKLS